MKSRRAKRGIVMRNPIAPRIDAFAVSGHVWIHKDAAPNVENISVKENGVLIRKPFLEEPFSFHRKAVDTDAELTRVVTQLGDVWKLRDLGRAARKKLESYGKIQATIIASFETAEWIGVLQHLATKKKDLLAGMNLASFTVTLCEFLKTNEMELIRSLRITAHRFLRWPVLRSPTKLLNQDEDALFANLQLGRDSRLELHPTARWKMDEATKIARELMEFVNAARVKPQSLWYRRALELKAFDKDSAANWWSLGKEVFLWSYPCPEKLSEFKRLVKSPSDTKPSRVRARIIELIKKRFINMAVYHT